MKKTIIFSAMLLMSLSTLAQKSTDYNRNGDAAMKRHNYRDAKIYYQEGVANCDSYSINALTYIWRHDSTMHNSMQNVMNKCLTCLTDKATENNDIQAINKLIIYYTEGIGTPKNESKAQYWASQLNTRNYASTNRTYAPKEKIKTEFFAGYSMSFLAPVGATFGVIGNNIGGYLRFRTNMSFLNAEGTYNGATVLDVPTDFAYQTTGNLKKSSMILTGGLVLKAAPSFYLSAGAGYWKRDLFAEFTKVNLIETNMEGTIMAKWKEYSYEGIALDLDGMYRIGDSFYCSAGVSALNIKYLYLNLGIGIFF